VLRRRLLAHVSKEVLERFGPAIADANTAATVVTAEPVIVRMTVDGLAITGEGVVREEGDTIRVTA
jgi:hypothetical protein